MKHSPLAFFHSAFLTSITLTGGLWLLLLFGPVGLQAAPVVAEFQADNADTIKDDDGQNSDWIELHNPDSTAVNLVGYGLTDDPAVPLKWVMPTGSLAPGASLLVWASGKNRVNPSAPLHTNFNLKKEGGYLAFMAPNGTTKLSEFLAYPAQPPDRSFGTAIPVVSATVLAAGATCKLTVPGGTITGWEGPTFNDAGWTTASTGIGYDRVTVSSVNYLPLIGSGGNVESVMYNIRGTCYVRVPFTITDVAAVRTLTLRMKYEDGFAAFLNGVRLNPPLNTDTLAPAALAFDSKATTSRIDSEAIVFRSFDLSGQRNLLLSGTNVLAIQMLNQSITSSDLIMVPELDVTRANTAASVTGYFALPTPGAANGTTSVNGFVDAPDFTVKRGFFSAPFQVTLTTKTPGAVIRYRTDGITPTSTTGTVYTGPVSVANTMVLRAAAYFATWQPSVTKSHTYVFPSQVAAQPATRAGFPTTWGYNYNYAVGALDSSNPVPADYAMDPTVTGNPAYAPIMQQALSTTLPVVSLAADTNELFALNGIYANGRITAGTEIGASIEWFDPHDPRTFQEDAGLRIHGGNAPIDHPKKPFRIYFRKSRGTDRLRFPLFPDSPVASFDKIQLRPGGHDGWAVPFGSDAESLARHATYMRDRFLRQTELDMGRLSPHSRYVHVYINALYWGVYDLHEIPSKEYFSDHLGGEDADWDVVEQTGLTNPLFDQVDGTGSAMDQLLALCRPPSNLLDDANYQQAAQLVSIDDFIDYLIVQMWAGQNDWMGPVYRSTENTNASRFFNKNWDAGRRSRGADPLGFLWNVWDAEISMGSSLTTQVSTMRVTDFDLTRIGTPASITGIAGVPGPPAEIYYALRQNVNFRVRFGDRLRKHFFDGGVMTVARNTSRLEALQSQLHVPIVAESARWGDVNNFNPLPAVFTRDEHWLEEVNWMKNVFLPTRTETVLSQFRNVGLWPVPPAPNLTQSGGTVPQNFLLGLTSAGSPLDAIYYTLDGSDPLRIESSGATLLASGASCKFTVPTSQYEGNSWKNLLPPSDYDAWIPATIGLGYGNNAAFTPFITTPVSGMANVNSTIYVRVPFNLTAAQKQTMTALTLKLKFDDGVLVFLNGSTPLLRTNAPNTSPTYNASATANRTTASAITDVIVDLTSSLSLLQVGENVLAFQGLATGLTDPDFLLAPQLEARFESTAPSASALLYVAEFPLMATGSVKARTVSGGYWSPLTEADFLVGIPATAANLVISEFSYRPAPAGTNETGYVPRQFEFIELMNVSASPVELTGLKFDFGIDFDFADSLVPTLGPGARIVLAAHGPAFRARYPRGTFAGTFAGDKNLSNDGERLRLLDAAGIPIVDFVYSSSAPWPTSVAGGGFSLTLINPRSLPNPANPESWRASAGVNGTPGSTDVISYALWAAEQGFSANGNLDDNANGLTNFVEYALAVGPPHGDPHAAAAARFESVLVEGVPQDYLVAHFKIDRRAEDAIVVAEHSDDLTNWVPMTTNVSPPVDHPDGTTTFTVRTSNPLATTARAYFRVSVKPR